MAGDGWLDLGTYYFDGSDEYVELADQTGEPGGSTVVVFDAVRWSPVAMSGAAFNAKAQTDLAYDVVVSGEEARLLVQLQNTGNISWAGSSFVLIGDEKNPAEAPSELALSDAINPADVASWNLQFPLSGAPGVRTVRYQMQHSGEPFGDVITGYVIVLPEQARRSRTAHPGPN